MEMSENLMRKTGFGWCWMRECRERRDVSVKGVRFQLLRLKVGLFGG
jgi:hypothetical protein